MYVLRNKFGRLMTASLAALLLSLSLSQSAGEANVAPNRPAEASKVHLVLLGYTPNKPFGIACRKDIESMKKVLGEALNDALAIHDLSGKNPATGKYWTPAEVTKYLRTMPLGPNESVVVFHSGHGKITDEMNPERSQHLMINDNGAGRYEVTRGEITNILRCRHPRAVIVLTDCCSKIVPEVASPVSVESTCGELALNVETVRNLFLRVTGVISITAADDDTCGLTWYSGANPAGAGSSFTVALLRLCYNQDRDYVTWQAFFPDLREETFRASSGHPFYPPHKARYFHLLEVLAN